MDTFATDLLESVHGLDDQIPHRISKPRARSAPRDADARTETNPEVVEGAWNVASGGIGQKNSSGKKRLGCWSYLRVRASDIEFASSQPHKYGGKAEVVKATLKRAESTKLEVAVKKVRYGGDMTERKFCNEFVHEMDMMAQLLHRNIARLIGFVEDLEEGKAWIVMCWEPNGNVSEFLATGQYEIPERISLIKDTFAGIKYLHTRQPPICQGDLKSLNILVSASYRAVITDFGSARIWKGNKDHQEDQGKVLDAVDASVVPPGADERIDRTRITIVASSNQLTLTGPAWSLRWAAPEVAWGEPQSLESDIWAAGWICWEVVTNKVPFPELNSEGAIVLKVVEGQVPAAREDTQLSQVIRLCSLMTDCWAFDPGSRPNIARLHREVRWMPSVRPLGRKPSGSNVPSAELLCQMGIIYCYQSSFKDAIPLFQQALSIATSAGNQKERAEALLQLGKVYYITAKYAEADQYLSQSRDIYTQIGDQIGQANALRIIGDASLQQSKLTEAEQAYTRARNVFALHGHVDGQALMSRALGSISHLRSQYLEAEEFYNGALDMFASIGYDMGLADTLMRLGELFCARSEYAKAEKSFNQALDKYYRFGDNLGRANVKKGLADLYRMQGLNTKAAPLYAEARTIYAQVSHFELEGYCSHWLDMVSRKGDSSITAQVSVPGSDDVPSATQ